MSAEEIARLQARLTELGRRRYVNIMRGIVTPPEEVAEREAAGARLLELVRALPPSPRVARALAQTKIRRSKRKRK